MKVLFPATVEAALDMLRAEPDARVMAGGTDLLVKRHAGSDTLTTLVCLEKIADLVGFKVTDDQIRIDRDCLPGRSQPLCLR